MNKAIRNRMLSELHDKEARRDYSEEFLSSYLALQIKANRQRRKWSQENLAKKAGLHQSQISEMEDVDHSSWTIQTLTKIARAFDVTLRVKLASFGDFLSDYCSADRESLEVPAFCEDSVFQSRRTLLSVAKSDSGSNLIHFPIPDSAIKTGEDPILGSSVGGR